MIEFYTSQLYTQLVINSMFSAFQFLSIVFNLPFRGFINILQLPLVILTTFNVICYISEEQWKIVEVETAVVMLACS